MADTLDQKEMKGSERLKFALAGASIFTIKSMKTDRHYTYKLKKGNVRYFCAVNSGDTFIPIGSFRFDDYQRATYDAPSMKALKWFLRNPESEEVAFYHMGRCGRCGRPLTNPESIESGYGPECIKHV